MLLKIKLAMVEFIKMENTISWEGLEKNQTLYCPYKIQKNPTMLYFFLFRDNEIFAGTANIIFKQHVK